MSVARIVRRRLRSWRKKCRCCRRNSVLSPRPRVPLIAAFTNYFPSPPARINHMPLTDTASLVRLASRDHYAVVQINTNGGTYDITRAIIESAEEERSPVILGCYEANLTYRGYEYASLQMRFFAERAKVPVAIHLDHGSSIHACEKAIAAGFTSVMIDGSHLPIEQNVEIAQKVVALSHPRGVSVEAEVGELQKLNPDGSMSEVKNLSDPREAKLMSETG